MNAMSDEEKERIKEQTKVQLEAMQEYGKEQQMKMLKYIIPISIILFIGFLVFMYVLLFTDLLMPQF